MKYKNYVESTSSEAILKWKGFLPTKEFRKEIGRCSVFLMTPKWDEAFGNVIVEALASGVPVVSYKRGGPCEIIDHGVMGYLVKPNDVNLLAEATKKAFNIDRRKCREYGQKGFSLKSFSNRLECWLFFSFFEQPYQHRTTL